MAPLLEPIPEYCDLMPLKSWQDSAKAGSFIPYDGDGYWATSAGMDRATDVWAGGEPPAWATHVAWFNR